MARYTDASCRLCRREGEKLFLKGERCYTNKCAVAKRPYAPGQHGEKKKKMSGVQCPTCKKGEMMERRGRFGIFYSCSNYPDCKNAIKAKPTGCICEMCGSLMMDGTKTIPERCSNKTCPNHNPHKLEQK